MNAKNSYGFQQLVELCKQTHQEIPQTMSAKFGMNKSNFSTNFLKEAKYIPDFHAYAYYPKLTWDVISQQSADQLLGSCINPVEFDGVRMKTDLFSLEQEQEDKS
jgi:hypothetical protein